MKYLLLLLLFFSFSAFAGDYYQQRNLELKQRHAMEAAIRADKTARYNLEQSRPDPAGETSDERWERLEGERDDYYHSLH